MPRLSDSGLFYQYDICAVIVLTLILFSLYFRHMTQGTANKSFIHLCILSLFTALADITAICYCSPAGAQSVSPLVFSLIQTIYFILRSLNAPCYALFMIADINCWTVIKNKPFSKKLLYVLPISVLLVCLIVNIFVPFMFRLNPATGYERLPCLSILYVVSGCYIFLIFWFVIKNHSLYTRVEYISILTILPVQMLAITFQCLNPKCLVEMFANACSMLLLTILVHRPELVINWDSGTRTKHAFIELMHSIQALNRPVSIIFVYIRNYQDLKCFLTPSRLSEVFRTQFASAMKIKTDPFKAADFYYLEKGLLAIVCDKVPKKQTEAYAENLSDLFSEPVVQNGIEIHPLASICYYDSPDDIDYSGNISFVQNYISLLPHSKFPLDISTIKNYIDFHVINEIDHIIARTIKQKNFNMFYQPIWSTAEEKFVSAEALFRLCDDRYGIITPELFMKAAEKSGAIHQMGDLIIEYVCRFIASDTFKMTEIRHVSMNLTVGQCLQPNLVQKMKGYLQKYGITPDKLILEIAEREHLSDNEQFDENIRQLAELGFVFSLDDYGTGYSNIQHIFSLPIQYVKIDWRFTRDYADPKTRAMIISMVKMIKDMGKNVIIEGVEDDEALEFFKELECQYIQGYLLSLPLSDQGLREFLPEGDYRNVVYDL